MMRGIFVVYLLLFSIVSYAATFTVTSTAGNDYSCAPNATNTNVCLAAGTLGWAISSANANPGPDVIDFNLASGSVINVQNPNWLLITEEVTIDATINSMNAAWVTAGSCNPIIGVTCGYSRGFDVDNVPNVTIRGLVLQMQGNAISFAGAGVTSGTVEGSWFGLTMAGTAAAGNVPANAILIESGATNVVVGGAACAQRNVVLGNQEGIKIDAAHDNVIIGNYFNTRFDGSAYVSPGSPQACVRMNNASLRNTIGTNTAGEGNLLCINNGQAIYVTQGSDEASIVNNKINTTLAGTALMPVSGASHSIHINASCCGIIQNNAVAIASTHGIQIQQNGTDDWTIENNTIGIGADGTSRIAYAGGGFCVLTQNAGNLRFINNTCGFSDTETGLQCEGPSADSIYFSNNKVGVNATGVADGTDYGCDKNGIFIKNFATARFIDNVVSDNGNGLDATFSNGIHIETTPTIRLIDNFIGVDNTGDALIGNEKNGVFVGTGTFTTIVVRGNVIGDNGALGGAAWPNIHHGVQFITGTYTNAIIENNYVGESPNGVDIGNKNMGFGFWSTTNSTIQNNVANYNTFGLFLNDCDGNDIVGNTFNLNDDAVANQEGAGVLLQSGSSNNEITDNTINYNKTGIWLRADPGGANNGNNIVRNTIQRNGKTPAGGTLTAGIRFPVQNDGQGITIGGSSNNNTIGNGATLADLNEINNNRGEGIVVDNSDNVEIRKNSIYCNGGDATERADPLFAITLLNGANGGITPPGPYVAPPTITAGTGIQFSNITSGSTGGTDVVEVYSNTSCGCQAQTYLGDGINGGTGQWSYPPGGNPTPIPASHFCGSPGVGSCPITGMQNVSANRTSNPGSPGRTSEFMCDQVPLPVEYLFFKAEKLNASSAILEWATVTEENNAYFEILRSKDGSKFTSIGFVNGAGNAVTINNYSFIDTGLEPGVYYYMLVQVDFDGKETMSAIRSVNLDGAFTVAVYPNPTTGSLHVTFPGNGEYGLIITNAVGQSVATKTVQGGGEVDQVLDLSDLADGVYIIEIQGESDRWVERIVKK